MATAAADFQSSVRSKTTTSRIGTGSASAGSKDYFIHQGVIIRIFDPQATAVVEQPFIVEVVPMESDFLATSRISNAYELGVSVGQALRNYLEFLVDELIWLQTHEKELSPSITEDLRLLQNYLRIV